jgi:hypothetical protein
MRSRKISNAEITKKLFEYLKTFLLVHNHCTGGTVIPSNINMEC